jgi:hypothetical protein
MQFVVYKYPLAVVDEQTITLPIGSQILTVQNQQERLVLYAQVNPNEPCTKQITIRIRGTGQLWTEDDETFEHYIGTVMMANGMVWHVFRVDDLPF